MESKQLGFFYITKEGDFTKEQQEKWEHVDKFPFDVKFKNMSIMLNDMIGDLFDKKPQTELIPVPFKSFDLIEHFRKHYSKIAEYVDKKPKEEIDNYNKHYKEHGKEDFYHPNVTEFDIEFVEKYKDDIYELILLANYLNIPLFYYSIAAHFAKGIKGKTPQEIAKYLRVEYIPPK